MNDICVVLGSFVIIIGMSLFIYISGYGVGHRVGYVERMKEEKGSING